MVKRAKKVSVMDVDESIFKTIGDVSSELNIPAHVLRFWEGKFSSIKPIKRKGGHRYYRPEDIEEIKKIQDLLHHQGYTIRGAQKFLKNSKKPSDDTLVEYPSKFKANSKDTSNSFQGSLFGNEPEDRKIESTKVKNFIKELEQIKDMLNSN